MNTKPINRAGFTLIELMVVIAIISIIAAIALPAYQGHIQRQRLNAATEAVYGQIQFARTEAIKNGISLQLSVVADTPWCIGMSSSAADCDCNSDTACVFGSQSTVRNLRAVNFPGVTIQTSGSNFLIDGVRGGFDVAQGSITLTAAGGEQTRVSFRRLGQLRMCSVTSGGAYQPC